MGCLSSKAAVAPDEPVAPPKQVPATTKAEPAQAAPVAPAAEAAEVATPAAEVAAPAAAVTGDSGQPTWADEPPEPLSKAVVELIEDLYDMCDSLDGTVGDGIKIAKLADIEISVGAVSLRLCSELAEADTSKDGFVTLEELTAYFTRVTRFMNETETRSILEDLVASIGPTWAAEPAEPLSEAQLALVQKLYDLCDPLDGSTGDGIQTAKLAEQETQIGAHTVKLCKELTAADTSQDGIVTLEELTAYFTTRARFLSEDDFAEVLNELIKGVSPAWEAEAPKPLTEGELALVQQLYDLCDPLDGVKGDGIQIAKLADEETSMGAHKMKLCKELAAADTSQDGIVTLEELTAYFTKVARWLSEDEFSLIVGDLIENIPKPEAAE